MLKEIWKDVAGYNGRYQVSNLGNVKSFYGNKEKILKPRIKPGSNTEYYIVKLSYNNISNEKHIHRLVAQAFLGLDIKNTKVVVCHKDDNGRNNRLDNLFLGTHKDNNRDMYNKGRSYSQKKIAKIVKDKPDYLEYYDRYDNFNDGFCTF